MKKMMICLLILLPTLTKGESRLYTNNFLDISISTAVSGQGGCGQTFSEDYFSSFYNPALLNLSGKGVSLSHSEFFSGLFKFDVLGFNYNIKNDHLGLLFVRGSVDNIPDTRNALVDLNQNGMIDPGETLDEDKISYFSNSDYALYFSYANHYKNLRFGINSKIIYRKLAEEKAWGIGFDLGLLYQARFVNYGLMLKNISTTVVSWSTGLREYSYPEIHLSSGFHGFNINPSIELKIFTSLYYYIRGYGTGSMLSLGNTSLNGALGTSVSIKDFILFRLGFDGTFADSKIQLNQFLKDYITFGLSVNWHKFAVDYSFIRHHYLQNTHKIALSYTL